MTRISKSKKKNDAKPIFICPVFPSGHRGGGVYDPNGIAPTIISNHGEVIRVIIYGGKDNTGDEPITLCEI